VRVASIHNNKTLMFHCSSTNHVVTLHRVTRSRHHVSTYLYFERHV